MLNAGAGSYQADDFQTGDETGIGEKGFTLRQKP